MHQRETTFGEQLRQFRLRVGLSQAALAERANLSTAAVAALERGARNAPYPRTLDALARALELSRQEKADLLAAGTRAERAPPPDPPSVEQPVSATQLPTWPTSLVGRATDVDRVRSLLSPTGSAARLLTLLGPGGVGKTRLACAAAAGLAGDFPDGIVFVDLAPLRDARLVPVTIARAASTRKREPQRARTPARVPRRATHPAGTGQFRAPARGSAICSGARVALPSPGGIDHQPNGAAGSRRAAVRSDTAVDLRHYRSTRRAACCGLAGGAIVHRTRSGGGPRLCRQG
jgi:transcriptional regulator with XRE-family HTH domain